VVAALAITMTGSVATAAHAAPSTTELKKKITTAQNQLEDVIESYNKMNISLKATIKQESDLKASLGPAKAARDAASVQIGLIAASDYKVGKVGTMNVLLEGPDKLLDRMSVLDQLARGRTRDIQAYTTATQTYTERQAALKTTQDKQAAEVKELGARKTKIENDIKKLKSMMVAATGSATDGSGARYTGPIPSISGAAGKAVSYAYNAIGSPYKYATSGPSTYDCSGLTAAAWESAGKSLPHNAAAQYGATARISRSDLQPGDLVFYRGNGHVGIYVGGGMIIDAPHTGSFVGKRSIDIMTPNGYGRVR
jgi:peptidoglycan DL-endopeptidase CwlO